MRILVLLSMIVAIGILSGCGGLDRLEVAEIRGDCPEEAIRAATLDSGWRNLGMTLGEHARAENKYNRGEYESREEYLNNLGREGDIRILRRIARTFERNIDRTIPSCCSEVWLDQVHDTGFIFLRYWFLLERRNGRTLACLSRCIGCGRKEKFEYEPESYDFCVDRKGEVQ